MQLTFLLRVGVCSLGKCETKSYLLRCREFHGLAEVDEEALLDSNVSKTRANERCEVWQLCDLFKHSVQKLRLEMILKVLALSIKEPS